MARPKPSRGPYRLRRVKPNRDWALLALRDNCWMPIVTFHLPVAEGRRHGELKANARLVLDAFRVYDERKMTPRDLLHQIIEFTREL